MNEKLESFLEDVERSYPGFKLLGISQIFVTGCGWQDCMIGNITPDREEAEKLIEKGKDSIGRIIEVFNLKIKNGDGDIRYPDFRA